MADPTDRELCRACFTASPDECPWHRGESASERIERLRAEGGYPADVNPGYVAPISERTLERMAEYGIPQGIDSAQVAVRELLATLGEDVDRDGLRETPARVVKYLREATSGYGQDPADLFKTFENDGGYNGMVSVGPIAFHSLCEHHLAPFFGHAWVAYIPAEVGESRVVGLSKLARLVDVYARRLQVQERMTQQIAKAIKDHLRPAGVGVTVVARHLCMESRGVRKPGASTRTTSVLGVFRTQHATREEWLSGCVNLP